MTRRLIVVVAALVAARCALYSEVSIEPLIVDPVGLERGSDIRDMVRHADYLRAVAYAKSVEARERKDPNEVLALAKAELAANRTAAARRHFRTVIDLTRQRDLYSEAAWGLSQVEFMENSYETSLDWANVAVEHGLAVLQWHLDFLRALEHVQLYRHASGPWSDEIPLKMGRPDVPRIDVRINNAPSSVPGVLDSGAVLSIVSQRFATQLGLKKLPVSRGTFYGLLGEPIGVDFALLDALDIGAITIENVPVAIMPDDKMHFFVAGKKQFDIDFLLGANLLKEFRFDFDFERNRLGLTQLTTADKQPVDDQNVFFESFRPYVRGTINKKGWYLFVLDTGSEITFLNEARVEITPINMFAPRVHNATLQGLGGAKKHGSRVDDVEIGVDRWAGHFKTLPMYTGSEHERAVGIVGENFLENFRTIVDFGRMRVDLKRR